MPETVNNPVIGSESSEFKRPSLSIIMSTLRNTQLASFDIFDTLLLRPFADPKDLFYILGEKFHEIDFYNLRIRCEREARIIHDESKYGNREINIYDIYERINYYTDLDVEYGVKTEFETEMALLYPNDYTKYLFDTFKSNNVPIVICSDMYYPAEMMEKLLFKNGITGYEKLYVSCDEKCSKTDGSLFKKVASDFPDIPSKNITHIDDNWPIILKARETGISAMHYPINKISNKYRPVHMSEMIGSAYKGVVNNYMAHNETEYSVAYEYGFIYGGFLLLGYCSYIHRTCVNENIEKVLFMSRDGDIMKQVWDYLYNDIPSEYILTSRESTMRTSVKTWKKIYIEVAVDRMSTRRQPLTISEALDFLQIPELEEELQKFKLLPDAILSQKIDADSVSRFRDLIVANIDFISEKYSESNKLYADYLENLLSNASNKVALVDIGWRGVNGYAIAKLIEQINPAISTINFLIGGRQPVNLPQIKNGKIKCWMFSAEQNYGVLNRHNKERFNCFYELLTMSASSTFRYFFKDSNGNTKIEFSPITPENFPITLEIQRGIMDFVKEYTDHFAEFPEFMNISPDDAAEVIYHILNEPQYFEKYFSELAFSGEINNDDTQKFKDWIKY